MADRLHNLQMSRVRRQKSGSLAKETMDIYVPVSARLVFTAWKSLEDWAFRYLYPPYDHLNSQLKEYIEKDGKKY